MPDSKSQLHQGHRNRLRQEVRAVGMKGMSPHRALEYLLSFVIARKDTNELAHTLINTFGSYRAVMDASYDELIKIRGIGEVTATFIISLKYFNEFYCTKSDNKALVIGTPIDAVKAIVNMIADKPTERFVIMALDKSGKVLGSEATQIGDDDSVRVNAATIYKFVSKYNASRVILGHNHPNNNPAPSQNDIDFTYNTTTCMKQLGIAVVDHIIVTPNENYFSFAKYNLLDMMLYGKHFTTEMIKKIIDEANNISEDGQNGI